MLIGYEDQKAEMFLNALVSHMCDWNSVKIKSSDMIVKDLGARSCDIPKWVSKF